jgi:hypothetical protein
VIKLCQVDTLSIDMISLLRAAAIAVACSVLTQDAECQSPHSGHPRCTGVFFSSQAQRVDEVCCSGSAGAGVELPPASGGHRRAQSAGTCDGVPPTCESQLCASTYTEFFETCRTQLLETPNFPDYQRLYSECSTLAHDCGAVYLGESVGTQRVFKWNDATGGCTLQMAAVESFCRDPVSLAECLEHIGEAQPEPEPEPEVQTAGCQQVFLGPDMGFVDVMERDARGECTLSVTMLSVVCSGPMFQTCIDFLHSSGEGPGDAGDPDYANKHPGGGH